MDKGSGPVSRSVNGYKHGRVPRAVRREQLLQLAEELFMENGHGGFSIDDLEETFGQPSFPADVAKILFAPHGRPIAIPGALRSTSWRRSATAPPRYS